MNFQFKRFLPHLFVVFGFIVISLLYFNPVLSGKMIYQNDIKLYEGMAKQQNDHRLQTGEETYWTNSAYGGMPTYQMGAKFPHDYMDKLDKLIRFLPRPADYLFLYFLSFYILMLVMRVPWKYAVIGALAFGLSTYLIIIIGVGHNSKAHAIAYFPLVLSGIILTFQKRYLWGFILTALAMGLEVQANHYQMTYYLGLAVVIMGIAYLVDAYKKKEIPHFFKSVGVLIAAVLLGLATNATTLLSTVEYAKTSIRGEKLLQPKNTLGGDKSDGLSYDYITEYSYGKMESLNLLVPKLFGAGRASDLGNESALYNKYIELGASPTEAKYYSGVPLYWGEQPFVEAPPYLGITVVFMALLGLLLVKGRLRWWLVGGMVLSLMLSWGKNFEGLTRFFIDFVPFYNKFRAVSSIQAILELLVPIAAVFGLYRFFNDKENQKERLKKLYITSGILGGLCLLFYLFGGSLFDLRSSREAGMAVGEQAPILNAIKEDRLNALKSDSLRSFLFILGVAGVLWLTFKKKLSENIAIVLIGLFVVLDLVAVDRRSVNEENFISEREYREYFVPTPADETILKDDGYFRVLDQFRGFNNSHTSYFFNSLNGYSAVRPQRMEDMYEKIITGKIGVLNMLNVKYIIQENEGNMYAQRNPYVNGPAWFVEELQLVPDYNEVYDALDEIDTKKTAVIRNAYQDALGSYTPKKDSLSTIELIKASPNAMSYKATNSQDGFAVFSEAFYKNGWVATIDGQETPIVETNYMLRGLKVPKGTHDIQFTFDPPVVKKGSMITLSSSIILLLIVFGGFYMSFRKRDQDVTEDEA
ncbi:YfhO family protein [Dokdonia pacifica]|uniref:Membrane protein YfhO n=1 Tax=Dokdonia pacifica TaxID=1627892 RepID=A0A239DU82_9FLAO|nr:YfhO family protein [Dokdonia pacifica]SNS36175.1 membrane protein YfhO [Dokdonia pacifica]